MPANQLFEDWLVFMGVKIPDDCEGHVWFRNYRQPEGEPDKVVSDTAVCSRCRQVVTLTWSLTKTFERIQS